MRYPASEKLEIIRLALVPSSAIAEADSPPSVEAGRLRQAFASEFGWQGSRAGTYLSTDSWKRVASQIEAESLAHWRSRARLNYPEQQTVAGSIRRRETDADPA